MSKTTTYTLTVWDEDGDTEQCTTKVYVNNNHNFYNNDNNNDKKPSCTIKLSNQYSGPNAHARLSWWSSDATHATISPSIGSVNTSDSMTVNASGNQYYTMTVSGQSGTATCHTSYIAPYLPPVIGTPYVMLTQIPYTGFDFGPLGNAMYWASMILLAGFGARLLTQRMGGMPQVAYARRSYGAARGLGMKETLGMQYHAFESVVATAAAPIRAVMGKIRA